jgi:hypothetical protein
VYNVDSNRDLKSQNNKIKGAEQMAKITFSTEKLVAGMTFKSISEMCRELNFKADGVPTNGSGNNQKAVLRELKRYAAIFTADQEKPRGNKPVEIIEVFDTVQAPPPSEGKTAVSELLRPIIKNTVNEEYEDNAFIKFHRGLTVDLKYMANGYSELYKALHRNNLKPCGLNDVDGYAKHILKKLENKLKGHIKTCCGNLQYDGVLTYKTPVDMTDYDVLDFADKKLYDDFKTIARKQIDEETAHIKEKNPKARINYQDIPRRATEMFNKRKKELDVNYKPVKLAECWIFEIDGDFEPETQTIYPTELNHHLLSEFANLVKYDELKAYVKSDEYKKFIADNAGKMDFVRKDAKHCSDADVRQALTKKIRATTAEKNNIDEKTIDLDFSICDIPHHLKDIKTILQDCYVF